MLRYYHGAQSKVIATRPIAITDAEVGLDGPDEVSIASTFNDGGFFLTDNYLASFSKKFKTCLIKL